MEKVFIEYRPEEVGIVMTQSQTCKSENTVSLECSLVGSYYSRICPFIDLLGYMSASGLDYFVESQRLSTMFELIEKTVLQLNNKNKADIEAGKKQTIVFVCNVEPVV